MNHVYLNRAIRFLFVFGSIVLGIIALFYLFKVVYPFLIGLAFAFFINPAVRYFHKKAKIPRSLAVILVLILVLAIFAGFITFLIAEIVSGADHLAKAVPEQLDTLINYIEYFIAAQIIPIYNQLHSFFDHLGSGQQVTIIQNIQHVGKSIGTSLGDFIQHFFAYIPTILSWFPNAASVLIFSLLATFFISKDWERLTSKSVKWMPIRMKQSSLIVYIHLRKALFGFFKAQITLISMTTIIIFVGLLILRIKYAVTIALVAGFVDILPFVGTGLIFVPWIIYEAITGDMRLALGLAVLYILVLVQRQLMEPKVLSANIGLDPISNTHRFIRRV